MQFQGEKKIQHEKERNMSRRNKQLLGDARYNSGIVVIVYERKLCEAK